jgi:hypothetical protein
MLKFSLSNPLLNEMKDAHVGERVWVIGNGPSAEQWQMDELRELGGVTLGTNQCWRESPRTGSCFKDAQWHTFVAGHHFDNLMAGRVNAERAFVPYRYWKFLATRWPENRRKVKSALISTPILDDKWPSGKRGKPFQYNFDQRQCAANFAGQLALALSAFMGFTEIILIGFDANDGEGHFFDKDLTKHAPPGFSRAPMRQWFDAIGEWARSRPDVDLVNTSEGSAITQIPIRRKSEVVDGILSRRDAVAGNRHDRQQAIPGNTE